MSRAAAIFTCNYHKTCIFTYRHFEIGYVSHLKILCWNRTKLS